MIDLRNPYKYAALVLFLITSVIVSREVTGKLTTNAANPYEIVPEYRRSLRKILISVDGKSGLAPHEGLLKELPGYTEIYILVPEGRAESLREEIKSLPNSKKVVLVPYRTDSLTDVNVYAVFPEKEKLMEIGPLKEASYPFGTVWAQDLLEAAAQMRGGSPVLLVSDVHKWFFSSGGDGPERVLPDNYFIGGLAREGFLVKRVPFTFRGGNVLFDRTNAGKTAFVGSDALRLTQTVHKATRDGQLSRADVVQMVREHFNVDRVVIIGGNGPQPSLLFHLDQAMVFLKEGVVAVTNLIDKPSADDPDYQGILQVEEFLKGARETLGLLGYEIINMDTTAQDIKSHKYPVNGIPFKDARTGRRRYYMPVFEDTSKNALEILKGNVSRIEALGYDVTTIATEANKTNGGLHCLFNVIQ